VRPNLQRLRTQLHHQGGYSLTEVVVALGLVLTTALPMLSVLSTGLNDSRVTVQQRTVEAVRSTLRTKLQSPTWPQNSSGNWTAQRWFDADGMDLGADATDAAVLSAKMSAGAGYGYLSQKLEAIQIEFVSAASGQTISQCVIQRARQDR
jgi:uncharacterized protein (TIGR02598 family)